MLAKLNGSCSFDVLLADKGTVSGSSEGQKQLMAAVKGLPCILMGPSPKPEDVMAGA